MINESQEIARFSGKGVLITPKTMEKPLLRWEKLEIILYKDKIVFEFLDKKIEANIEDIDDVGYKLPKKVFDSAKCLLEDITFHSTIVIKSKEFGTIMIGFAPETSLYGKTPIDNFLRKLFCLLLNNKEVKILYDVKEEDYRDKTWENGYLKFIKERIKEEVIVKFEYKLVVEVLENNNTKTYDIFSNIRDVKIEEKEICGEIKPILKIQQKKNRKCITSYLYTENRKVRLFLLRYMLLLLNCKHVGILKYLQETVE
ncbi:CheF family chemotaxis protein [Methanocaldococcus sp. 16A]